MHSHEPTLSWLSDAVREVYAAESPAQLATAAIGAIMPRFRSTICGLEELGYDRRSYEIHGVRLTDPLPPDFANYVHDHPGMGRILGGERDGLMHLREYAPPRIWERTDQYQGLARPMGWRDQLAIVSYGPRSLASYSFWRDTRFTDDERAQAALLQPHLDCAWHRVRPKDGVRAGGEWVPVTRRGAGFRVRPSRDQQALLRRYFPGRLPTDRLPEEVHRWLVAVLVGLDATPPTAPRPLIVARPEGTLLISAYPDFSDKDVRLWMGEFGGARGSAASPRRDLSPRESEVLHWIAEGKRDAEIAIILGCAPATVSKHVERILAKLRVGSRTEAVHAGAVRAPSGNGGGKP